MNTTTTKLERANQGVGSRPALIVVDVTLGFTDPRSPLGSDAGSVVAKTAALMDAFHARQLPVVLTTVSYEREEQARVFRARLPALNMLTANSDWVKIDPRLPVGSRDCLLTKTHASAFHGTDLDKGLQQDGVDSVVVCGLTTSGCVRATAVDGLQNDYRVVVVSDAVGDRDPAAHAANLYDLEAKYADVMACSDLIAALPD